MMVTKEEIKQASSGDKQSLELVKRYYKDIFIKRISQQMWEDFHFILKEEILHAAIRGLEKGLTELDHEKEFYDINSFLRICGERSMVSAIKAANRKKYQRDHLLTIYESFKKRDDFHLAENKGTHDVYAFEKENRMISLAFANPQMRKNDRFYVSVNGFDFFKEEEMDFVISPKDQKWVLPILEEAKKKNKNSKRLPTLLGI